MFSSLPARVHPSSISRSPFFRLLLHHGKDFYSYPGRNHRSLSPLVLFLTPHTCRPIRYFLTTVFKYRDLRSSTFLRSQKFLRIDVGQFRLLCLRIVPFFLCARIIVCLTVSWQNPESSIRFLSCEASFFFGHTRIPLSPDHQRHPFPLSTPPRIPISSEKGVTRAFFPQAHPIRLPNVPSR